MNRYEFIAVDTNDNDNNNDDIWETYEKQLKHTTLTTQPLKSSVESDGKV